MNHLMYYFGYNEKLFLDCVPCVEGQEPELPKYFLTWCQKDDLIFSPSEEEQEAIKKSDSPVFAAMYSNKKVSKRVTDLVADLIGKANV